MVVTTGISLKIFNLQEYKSRMRNIYPRFFSFAFLGLRLGFGLGFDLGIVLE